MIDSQEISGQKNRAGLSDRQYTDNVLQNKSTRAAQDNSWNGQRINNFQDDVVMRIIYERNILGFSLISCIVLWCIE